MFRICKILLTIPLFLLLSGCWDEKTIQDFHYITAIGIDFKDGDYIVYTQLVDFAAVAKTEAKPSQNPPVYVGKQKGSSISIAVNNLMHNTQQALYIGHVSTFVISENVLKQQSAEIVDYIYRNQLLRYSANIFATKSSMDDLFSINGYFNLSPLYTTLFLPEDVYRNRSYIEPITVQRYYSNQREKASTTILPSISWNDKVWKEKDEKRKSIYMDGAYVIYYKVSQPWFSEKELNGIRWLTKRTNKTPVNINMNKQDIYASFSHPHHQIKPVLKDGKYKFDIDVDVSGKILGLDTQMDITKIKRKFESQIKKEIQSTFMTGIQKNADPLNLGKILYIKETKYWQKNHLNEPKDYLDKDSLHDINVKVHILNTGGLEAKPLE
ncbi:Ger(x)C family spore germination protein [Bacillus sp. ISL-4]|uniref:Ger(x)C family spore germination protein n=1 Tax=Bacillus sp. ISL-4 TaxID=2819125 RepID=UPI001BEB9E6D|nr:Ger(x)C family spore germination protein [Bacillus sp. ISL-4]MBT2664923.1 Ger(x)C family spore germination protein [Bacillus sp. ISL-4]MBT2672216.1 Ger(x)C family spore germination protein [Streptomyces sp. ISL-14]